MITKYLFLNLMALTIYQSSNAVDMCLDGTIRVPRYTKTVEEKKHYCYTPDEAIYSPSCKNPKFCISSSNLNKISKKDLRTNGHGTPGSRACLFLNGQAQVIEFLKVDQKAWIKTSRCVFNDKDFIDTDLLLRFLFRP